MYRGSQRSRCGSCNDLTKQERPRVLPRSRVARRADRRGGALALTRGCRGRALPSGVFYLTYLLTYTLLCRPDVLRLTSHRCHHAARTPHAAPFVATFATLVPRLPRPQAPPSQVVPYRSQSYSPTRHHATRYQPHTTQRFLPLQSPRAHPLSAPAVRHDGCYAHDWNYMDAMRNADMQR